MLTTRHQLSKCPICSHELDASVSVFENVVPENGDMTVCINCTSILEFSTRHGLVAVTQERLIEIKQEISLAIEQIIKVQQYIKNQNHDTSNQLP